MKLKELIPGIAQEVADDNKEIVTEFLRERYEVKEQARRVADALEKAYDDLCEKDVDEVADLLRSHAQLGFDLEPFQVTILKQMNLIEHR